jgi:hypothetical protein
MTYYILTHHFIFWIYQLAKPFLTMQGKMASHVQKKIQIKDGKHYNT